MYGISRDRPEIIRLPLKRPTLVQEPYEMPSRMRQTYRNKPTL